MINHYIVRTWPWFFCGLASIVLISEVDLLNLKGDYDPELAYPMLLLDFLPNGFLGLMIGSLIGAFMSSLNNATHNAAAVFVNDLYRPYLVTGRTDIHYLTMTRLMMVVSVILGISAAISYPEFSRL